MRTMRQNITAYLELLFRFRNHFRILKTLQDERVKFKVMVKKKKGGKGGGWVSKDGGVSCAWKYCN